MIGKWNLKSQRLPCFPSILLWHVRRAEERFVLNRIADVSIEIASVISSAAITRLKKIRPLFLF
jgi:hypothetical protein